MLTASAKPVNDPLLSAFFSDETETFRCPAEPEAWQPVTLRLRGPKADGVQVYLVTLPGAKAIPMRESGDDGRFVMFETEMVCGYTPVSYYYRIEYQGDSYAYQKDGLRQLTLTDPAEPRFHFCFTPGFHTPEWAKGAVQYQILTDRFCNGDPSNDVLDGEFSYNERHVRRIADWNSPPPADGYRCFYGGDIAGIRQKLDYLQSLGIEALYLNPVFLSPSSHKYDTQDYEHIDPHFGVIVEDCDHCLQDWEHHNGYARRYITRVLSRENLEKSNALFASFCAEVHRRGMRIILDGVFNHCSSFHHWLDREGIYRDKPGFAPGAYQDEASPYRRYFRFTGEKPGYDAWWGLETLPKLAYENAPELMEYILDVACLWARPPYSIDGWRLDVASDLGLSPGFNHSFWREFRSRLKQVNPELLIVAEHYGDPYSWLRGDQWDTVMNYDAFMEPVTYFLTGMEKHSDSYRGELYQDGERFFATMRDNMSRFQCCSLYCAMNELSNHDHSRFLTRTKRETGRVETSGPQAAGEGIDKAVLREAVAIQMTWPGAPTIYYGDEAGQVGWTDPDNRRTYPWGHEDVGLIELHRALISLRRLHPVLRSGSLLPLGAGKGWIAYARFDAADCVVTICNNGEGPLEIALPLWQTGAVEGQRFVAALATNEEGFIDAAKDAGAVLEGHLRLQIGSRSALILTPKDQTYHS